MGNYKVINVCRLVAASFVGYLPEFLRENLGKKGFLSRLRQNVLSQNMPYGTTQLQGSSWLHFFCLRLVSFFSVASLGCMMSC